MESFDNILLEILDKFITGEKVDVEDYCKKYPQYKNDILAKFRTAKFIQKNFQDTDLSGKNLGEYIILQELGRGGMGVVFLGIQPSLSRLSAIKVLSPSFARDKEALKNFQEEAKNIAKFNHPNIVPIYSISDEKGINFIAMGYISGPSLKNIIQKLQKKKRLHSLKAGIVKEMLQTIPIEREEAPQKSITLKRSSKFWNISYFHFVATIGIEIADALTYAHHNGIFHGDLKPSNILLTHGAIPMIADFGLSKDIKKIAHSKTKEFTGTLAYSAPEQIKENIINDKTDIWSLGVTLYELLTLRNPFKENTVKKTVDKILKSYFVPLRDYNKKIPVELEAIVLKCLENHPERRYNAIDELSKDLKNYLESKPIKAKPVGKIERIFKLIRRHPLLAFLSASLIVVLIASSLLFFNKKLSDIKDAGAGFYNTVEYDKALVQYEKYKKIVNFSPISPFTKKLRKEILIDLGDVWLAKGQYDNAITSYDKALEIEPEDYLAIISLGYANYAKDELDEALKFYEIAIKMRPKDIDNYYYMGKTLADKNMLEKAIRNYRMVISIDPNDIYTIKEIISVFYKKGLTKYDEIEKYLKDNDFNKEQIDSVFKILLKTTSLNSIK